MEMRKPKDFYSGLLFLVIGLGTIVLTRELTFGTARSMGPGYFPTMLGGLISALALVLMVRAFRGEAEAMEPLNLFAARAVIAILGSCLIFSVLVRPAGMIPAVAVTVLVAAWGMRGFGWRTAAILAGVLAIGCWLAFVVLLGLPVRGFGPWFGV
ncbi:tripartite tricarboxylate transporter TctB family protein [Paracoccus sp. N5]|uniref:tripartite tricarboxylate transporter TctB family protein n=1 Tax=Paracoccus sp. N5 TaxID=1101189 RepID=UPI000382C5FC|nr:tripartite tricarboxylate transporter TctB family protein [Paracoccus sp. N5]